MDDDAIVRIPARICFGWREADGMTEWLRDGVAVEAGFGRRMQETTTLRLSRS